jgi:nucleotide-binding universal stress UspA family protein
MQLAFRTILVPTDFGDAAQLALEYAQAIAKRFDAGLRVVHVVETPMPLDIELAAPDAGRANERAMDDARRGLAAVLQGITSGNVIGQLLVGHTADQIVAYAADHDVDLIVMGTHGRRALARVIVGSVAERVVRTAPCPVFTVRDSGALPRGRVESATAAAI